MENQVETFVIVSSIFLVFFILVTVYLIVKLKLNDLKLKRSEEKLRELNQLLQNKVEVRTRELDESQKKLHLLYEQHREVLENSPAGIIKIDNNLIIEYANPEMNIILGSSSERYLSITGKRIREITLFGNPELDNFFNDLQKGFEITDEINYNMKNKQKGSAIVHGVPLFENNSFNGAVILFSNITELKEAQEKIKASLLEKELLLKEINHRVKNNMQIISSMLKLQLNYIKDKEAHRLFQNSHERVKTMALVHEKLYQSQDLARINFGDYIRSLTIYLYGSYKVRSSQIKLKVEIENTPMDINTAIPCGLIINELVSNALKHAFPDDRKGIVHVSLRTDIDGNNILTVKDNGVGFPPNLSLKKSKTLGLQLLQTLVAQLHGRLELKRKKETTFTITFKDINLNSFKDVTISPLAQSDNN
ncbi:MAG: PAS domain S-box protein [Candidatus Cloacimonetes bacterium]|nr:PAS domain S-box protein [Candidatus Cloacimonadota bacterium]